MGLGVGLGVGAKWTGITSSTHVHTLGFFPHRVLPSTYGRTYVQVYKALSCEVKAGKRGLSTGDGSGSGGQW